jgi:uncharacterized membrane protein
VHQLLSRENGQATVELALCLPLVALLLAAVVEVGLLAVDRNRLWHSAREAARAAAVSSDRELAQEAAAASGLEGLTVEVEPEPHLRVRGEPATVTVTFEPEGHVPLVGGLVTGLELRATATMRIEQP